MDDRRFKLCGATPWSSFPYCYVQRNLRASLARGDMVGFAIKPVDAGRPGIESRAWVRLPDNA
jgi:hypothetical protein